MGTQLFWIDGPWPGKLAMSARPRGGDWLEDDLGGWHDEGVDVVVSLLTPGEVAELDLQSEAKLVEKRKMKFVSFPIPDRQVPASRSALAATLEKVNADLASGKNVLVHCRQGIGRSGMVAACLLVTRGRNSSEAVDQLSALRGVPVPETTEQRNWIDQYAALLAAK